SFCVFHIMVSLCTVIKVPHILWPAMTSDVNPIEHVCNQLKQILDDHIPPLRDLVELDVALVEEWNAEPQHIIKLVRGMRCHCHCGKWWKYQLLTGSIAGIISKISKL
uniref:Tc1-like transposase DDE domain-containing protein n=1 Tax=Oryzias latipes TaxID=8090 RepID=A0A3P9L9T2_ORYLA